MKPWHAQKHVLSRCIHLLHPSSSNPSFPVASSFIRYILLTAMEKKNCSTYIKQHSTVKQGGLQQRRSSRFVPATGLHWIHMHIGLVSCVILYSFTIPPSSQKKQIFCAKLTRKYLLVLSFLNKLYLSFPFCTLCHANDKKRLIFTTRVGMWAS